MIRMRQFVILLICTTELAVLCSPAAAGTTVLAGTVAAAGKPVASALVAAAGNNVTLQTQTDARGHFSFPNLAPGSYLVTATAAQGSASLRIDLPAAGTEIAITLAPKELGVVAVTAVPVRRPGTNVTLNSQLLGKSPSAGSFPELLVQLPGAARGANGVVHINGDHGDINYIVDGVSIPQELNRVVGSEFNPNNVSFVDVLEGAYPAQYGQRFASILNINTLSSAGSPGYSGDISAGSFGLLDASLGYQNRVGAGSLIAAVRNQITQRGLDPPNPASPHNNFSDANQFVRYTLPRGNDYMNLTISNAYQTFQIPNDVAGGEPPSTDDNESQADLFAALQVRHAVGTHGALSYGMGYKNSHIRDFGDAQNDWTYGQAIYAALGGAPTDCANAFTIPNFSNVTCAYSLRSDRTAKDYTFNIDDALNSNLHDVRWGASYDVTNETKHYNVSLQPSNFLAPLFSPSTPKAAYSVVDNAPNNANAESVYFQDSWQLGNAYELDYGLRSDSFQLRSTEFQRGYAMLSPRIKLTRTLNQRSSVYAFYGRFFTPFSFENVSPTAAFTLNLPLEPSPAAFDLKPQRDSVYEIGGNLPIGSANLGLRVTQKNATDLIDDTQVGVTQLHQDINYQQGRVATQTAFYQLPLPNQGSFYLTINHTYAVNKGCETQLLAPCFGSPTDWTPADHEQRWGSTAGIVLNNDRGGWFSMNGEYGSGLSSAGCPAGTVGYCKYTPHTVFNVEGGVAVGPQTRVVVRIVNLLNDRFRITYLNAQGNHYYTPRSFSIGLEFGKAR